MKILFANKFFFLKGGSERVFFQERDFLLEKGHSVVDFSMMDNRNLYSNYTPFFVPNVDYNFRQNVIVKAYIAAKFVHSYHAMQKIREIVCLEKPNIAHLHNIYHQLTPSIIPFLKKNDVKVVLTMHDLKLICPGYLALRGSQICLDCEGWKFWKPFTTNCQNSFTKGLLLSVEACFHQLKKTYEYVDYFLAPSNFVADLVAQRIDRRKIIVLHNGIDTREFAPCYDDDDYILYFGRLSREKGVTTLLDAQKKMRCTFPLKIIGSGPYEGQIQEKYPEVHLEGYKTGESLKRLIQNASFVVVPSEYYENCAMAVLEAMACGKPVIGSKIGGIPEQIDDNITGLLFEKGNVSDLAAKMDYLVENIDARKKMGKAARKKIEMEFSQKKHCESLVKIYENLLK